MFELFFHSFCPLDLHIYWVGGASGSKKQANVELTDKIIGDIAAQTKLRMCHFHDHSYRLSVDIG